MKAKPISSMIKEEMNLTAGKLYDVLDVEYYRGKDRYGRIKKILIKNEKRQYPDWYEARYFILAEEALAEALAHAELQKVAGKDPIKGLVNDCLCYAMGIDLVAGLDMTGYKKEGLRRVQHVRKIETR